MQAIILYSSKYGGSAECAERIRDQLPLPTTLQSIDENPTADLAPYDLVILGTSVYMGRPRKAMRQFAKKNMQTLLTKRLGLYLCCIQDQGQPLEDQFALAFPQPLREHAQAMLHLGGIVDFTKLKRIDRYIMEKVAGDLRKQTGGDLIITVTDARVKQFCREVE